MKYYTQYSVIYVPDGASFENELNLKGKDGWRLVSVMPYGTGREAVFEKLFGEGIACEPEMG